MTDTMEPAAATDLSDLDPKTRAACERNTLRIFLSHKAEDAKAARKIKEVLMNYAGGKLEIFTFEEIQAGKAWKAEVHENAQEANWFVLLFTEPSEDWGWCLYEAGIFRGNMGSKDRLVCLHHPDTESPNMLNDFQGVVGEEEPIKNFLRDLFGEKPFPCMEPINPFLTAKSERLDSLVTEIRNVLRPPKPGTKRNFFNEHIDIRIPYPEDADRKRDPRLLLKDAKISSEGNLEKILGLFKIPRSWDELRSRVEEDQKDLRWLTQLEYAIHRIANGKVFTPMQATFKPPTGGWFYRPVIHFVDEIHDGRTVTSINVHLLFTQEAAGGVTEVPGSHATITSTMNMGSRFRWEVLDKFVDISSTSGGDPESSEKQVIRLRETIDSIESETLSRGLFDVEELATAFRDEARRKKIRELLERWKKERAVLDEAIGRRLLSRISDSLAALKDINKEIMTACCKQYQEFLESW